MVEFTSDTDIRNWVDPRAVEDAAIFAGLCAAAVWPFTLESNWVESKAELKAARAILTAKVRGFQSSEKIRGAAAIAGSRSARSNLGSASSAAAAALISAYEDSVQDAEVSSLAVDAAVDGLTIAARLDLDAAARFATAIEMSGPRAALILPIWPEQNSEVFAEQWEIAREQLALLGSATAFWIDWYEGLIAGRAPDMALWHEIALIPDEIWEEGRRAVARAIEGIKAQRGKTISSEQARSQAERLVAQPKFTKLTVSGAAHRIDESIAAFLNETKLNRLPDPLMGLYDVSASLKSISTMSQSGDRIAELEREIIELAAKTSLLTQELVALKNDPKPAGRLGRAVDTAISVAVGAFVGSSLTGVGEGFSYVTGYDSVPEVLEAIGEIVDAPEVIVDRLPQIDGE